MKLISFIVGRHSFGTHLACVPNGRDGRTFVGWRRAERSRMSRQGKLVSCYAPISGLFSTDESRNAALATLQRIVLTEKLLGSITRGLQITHLQAPNL